jgi:hypothetical protein
MARTTKNNIKKKDEPKPVHTCGECGWGKFYYEHSNLDMAGEPDLFKMPVCRKSQYDTFGKSVRQMENETINWSFFKIPGF